MTIIDSYKRKTIDKLYRKIHTSDLYHTFFIELFISLFVITLLLTLKNIIEPTTTAKLFFGGFVLIGLYHLHFSSNIRLCKNRIAEFDKEPRNLYEQYVRTTDDITRFIWPGLDISYDF